MKIFSFIVALVYLATWLKYLHVFLTEGDRHVLGARVLAVVAVALHGIYFASLGLELRHPPMGTVFESLTTLALMLSVIYLHLEFRSNTSSTGMPIFFMVFGLQLVSSLFMKFTPDASRMMGSPMLIAHIFLALVGYTAFAVAFLYSILYLLLHRELRSGKFRLLFRNMPSIEELDEMNFRASLIGLIALFVSVALGFAWSEINFGQLPFSDPKVTMTVLTWLIYLVIFVFKTMFGWSGKRIAVLSVCGFLLVLVSIALINQMPSTFHNMY
ncbi:MAG: cytochrome c biogenesis protein CcsA [bacterium]